MWIGPVSLSRCPDRMEYGPPILLARTARKSCGALLLGVALAGCLAWGTVARCAAPSAVSASFSRPDYLLIEDYWIGETLTAPWVTRITLRADGEKFTGPAFFSAGNGQRQKTAHDTVVIPRAAVQEFLSLLLKSPMRPGKYTPRIDYTDDYPNLRIVVKQGKSAITFFTRSQGKDYIPWGAQYQGKISVVDSELPARALQQLRPYMKRPVLEKLIDDARKGP